MTGSPSDVCVACGVVREHHDTEKQHHSFAPNENGTISWWAIKMQMRRLRGIVAIIDLRKPPPSPWLS